MRDTKTDNKNIALAKLAMQLRDDIDLDRLIGLNVNSLRKIGFSNMLLGHIQSLAHGSIAICICKIYEDSKRNELDSIPAIIESLPTLQLTNEQRNKLTDFGARYGNTCKLTDPKSYLKGTLGLFVGMHSLAFEELKKYRDKIGAHSESQVNMSYLPSHDDFESFFNFAKEFYEIVCKVINKDIIPAKINNSVGKDFFKFMKFIGIDEPKI